MHARKGKMPSQVYLKSQRGHCTIIGTKFFVSMHLIERLSLIDIYISAETCIHFPSHIITHLTNSSQLAIYSDGCCNVF